MIITNVFVYITNKNKSVEPIQFWESIHTESRYVLCYENKTFSLFLPNKRRKNKKIVVYILFISLYINIFMEILMWNIYIYI